MKSEINLLKIARINIQLANILMRINDQKKLDEIINELNDKDVIMCLLLNNKFLSKRNAAISLIEKKLDENDCYILLHNSKYLMNSNLKTIISTFGKLDEIKRKSLMTDNNFVSKINNNSFFILFDVFFNKNDNESILLNPYVIERFSGKELLAMIIKSNNYSELLKNENVLIKISGMSIASVLSNNKIAEDYFNGTKIPINKAVIIINCLNLTNQEKEGLIRKHYDLDFANFTDLYNKIIEKCNQDILLSNSTEDLKILKNDLIGKITIDNNKLIETIINSKIEEPLIKEIIINHIISIFAKNMNLDIQSCFANLHEADGKYNYIFNTLLINQNYLTNNKNIELFNTIFHELIHVSQYSQVKELNYKYDNLKMVKDMILSNEVVTYEQINYWHNSIEVDARCKSFLLTYRLLKIINETEANNYLKQNIHTYKISVKLKKKQYRKIDVPLKITLEEAFLKKVSKEKIKEYLNEYPILKLEFDEITGETKDIVTLFSEYVYLKINSKNLEKKGIEFKKFIFLENYFNDKKNIYKETGLKETIDEYHNDFNKLKNSVYYNIEEYKKEIDLYINMQNRYFYKLESANHDRQ